MAKPEPYQFSDFYGYDQDCATLTAYSSSTGQSFSQICTFNGAVNYPANQTYYHDGSGSLPVAGDTCYSNSAGTTTLSTGYYYLSGSGNGNRVYIQIGSGGVVTFGGQQTC